MGTLIIVYVLIALGFLLCFIGKFPGQILAYAGMLVAHFGLHASYPTWLLIVCGVLVIASLIINKTLVKKLANKVHEFGKAGKAGTIVGSITAILSATASTNVAVIVALFIVLPYLLAFIFEFISRKNAGEGAKRALGAYIMYLTSTLLNVAICLFCMMEVIYGKF